MKTLDQIQIEVGEWSQQNFGDQESKVVPGLILDSLAPLMGIGEEIGEYNEASRIEDMDDALGDIGIYLCDYLYRENQPILPLYELSFNYEGPKPYLVIAYGKLLHTTLKYHQGIRNIDYIPSRNNAVIQLIVSLRNIVDEWDMIVSETWEEVVSKRNWKKDAANGS